MFRARISEQDELRVGAGLPFGELGSSLRKLLEGAGQEGALAVTGGIEAADDVGGARDGLERQLEGPDVLGVPARLKGVEVPVRWARLPGDRGSPWRSSASLGRLPPCCLRAGMARDLLS